VAEEEPELESAIRPAPARWPDGLVAAGSLVVMVAASVTIERRRGSGRLRDTRDCRRRPGDSNAINVVIGLLVPAPVAGLGRPSGQAILPAVWYAGLTAVVLGFATAAGHLPDDRRLGH